MEATAGHDRAERRKIRVLYYSAPVFIEQSLSLLYGLRDQAEVHFLMELAPEGWCTGLFDVGPLALPSGMVSADPILKNRLPAPVREKWQGISSFNLVVHNCRRSLHPSTWWRSFRVARYIRALRPDLVHLENVSLRMAPALQLLRGIPVILTVHDPESHSGEDNWRTRLARRLTFPTISKFVLYNSQMREEFRAQYRLPADRVASMKLGTYWMCREWKHEVAAEEERLILFQGRLSKYKGLEVLYEAAPLVAERVPSVRFIVAGKPEHGYAPPEPPQLPNGGLIELVDRYLHNAEMAQLFERSAIVVCPYLDATQSGVVLTAYAFGKPVVASRVGGLPEYVEDGVTGRLVEPQDAGALADALSQLLLDQQTRRRMAANVAQRAATEYSWDATAAKALAIYRDVLGREPTGQGAA